MPFRHTVLEACRALDLTLSANHLDRLERHYERLIQANRRFNLTRITDPIEAAVQHYADSLSAIVWARRHAPAIRTVLDVGTGGGFPAIPLAIVRPDWSVTAIDGTAKKSRFVAECAAYLGLENLTAVHGHTDHWQAPPEPFDLITFRAVGKLAVCIGHAQPLMARGGWLVCYKTDRIDKLERQRAAEQAKQRHLIAGDPWPYRLDGGDLHLHRQLVSYRLPQT